jgi:hypothetical protein
VSGEPPKGLAALERARVVATYAFTVLVVIGALVDFAGFPIDLGVYGMLVGGLLACLGLGSVIRLVVSRGE